MYRFTMIAALAALLPSGLTAQDEVIAYTQVAPAWSHSVAAGKMACSACHQTGGNPLDYTLGIASNQEYFNFGPHVVDVAVARGAVASNVGSSVIRLGNVTFVPLASELVRSHLPIDEEPAWMVSAVEAESDRLKRGDVVLTVNSIPVSDHAKIVESVEEDRGKPAQLLLIRGGKRVNADVTSLVLARPEQPYRIGVQVEQPSDALRSQLCLYENEGLLITDVVADSAAEKSGFQKHDILLRAGDQRISTLDDLRACVNESEGKAIELTFMRGGKEQKLSATPEQQEVDAVVDVYSVCPRVSHAELLLLDRSIYTATHDALQQAKITLGPTESEDTQADDE
ncbi:MAG: PDZ domain-containing protein [Planctomycetota bacterium]